jgi:SAM-dependent methyltransferase
MTDKNKHHWYDGFFYDKVIAPNQDKSFRIVKKIIEKNSTVVDVGCGTGRLGFHLADHCGEYVGIDLSSRNISTAKKKLNRENSNNLKFIHHDILQYLDDLNPHFDYAILSYVIHEIDPGLREPVLMKLSEAAEKIILIDYLHPKPNNIPGKLITVVEFLAGRDHYSNFKSFMKNEGLSGLAGSTGMEIIKEIRKRSSGTHISVMKKGL